MHGLGCSLNGYMVLIFCLGLNVLPIRFQHFVKFHQFSLVYVFVKTNTYSVVYYPSQGGFVLFKQNQFIIFLITQFILILNESLINSWNMILKAFRCFIFLTVWDINHIKLFVLFQKSSVVKCIIFVIGFFTQFVIEQLYMTLLINRSE